MTDKSSKYDVKGPIGQDQKEINDFNKKYSNSRVVIENDKYYSSNKNSIQYGGLSNSGQKTDFGESQYDDKNILIDDIKSGGLEQIRADKQGWGAEAVNAIGGGIAKIPFSVIGNVASMLDFEDYYNKDNEIGNSITAWAEEMKGDIEGATKIYKSNDNTLGSREWWMNNAKGLIDSAGGFVLTGAGLGKGVQLLSQLTKYSKVVQAIGTTTNAVMLNQAESVPIAMNVYNEAIKLGKSEQEAADAAAYSININRINIPLNLTSAYAFLRPVALTRQVAKDYSRKEVLANLLKEGSQEYLEENINMIAEKEAIRKAKQGNDYSYNFDGTVNDVLSKEGFETGLVGFLGGTVQTGGTDLIKSFQKDSPSYDIDGNVKTDEFGQPVKVSRITSQKERFKAQQKSLNGIEMLASTQGVASIKQVLDKVKASSELLNDIQIASITNDDIKVEELKNQLLTNQALDAFKNGTTEQLIDTYRSIQRDPSSKDKLGDDFMSKSIEAIKQIEALEKVYNEYSGLAQVDEVFNNRADYVYNLKEASRLKSAMFQAQTEQSREVEITGYNTEDKINTLQTSKELNKIKEQFNKVRDNVIKLNNDLTKIISEKYTKKVVKDQEKAKEDSKKEDLTEEEEEQKQSTINYGELVKNAKTGEELDSILDTADKEGLTNPELTDLIAKKRQSLKPVNKNTVQLNKNPKEEVDETEEKPPVLITGAKNPDNQLYPNIKEQNSLTYKANKKRDEISLLTKGELLSSAEVQELINKEGSSINNLITIDAVKYGDGKSVRVKIGDRVLGYFQKSEYNSKEINELIAVIKIGGKLSNAEVKKAGFNLNISDGYIKSSDEAINISQLDEMVRTGEDSDYVIFDQGTDKYRADGNNDPMLIRDAKGSVNIGDIKIPSNQRKLGRYILSFKEKTSGKQKFIPIAPSKLTDYKKYLSDLISLSSKIIKGDESGKFTKEQISEFNNKINESVFITLNNKEISKYGSVEADFNIDGYGNLRVNLKQVFYDSKIPDKLIYGASISPKVLSDLSSVENVLTHINELTTANSKMSITEKSFRNSIEKGSLTAKDVGDLFQTYTAPEVLEGQDVIISINKLDASANTITPEVKEKPISVDSLLGDDIKEESEEVDEFDVDTTVSPKTDDANSPVFKLSDEQANKLIDENELSEVERIVPNEISIETRNDIKIFLNSVAKNKITWGAFSNKVIYLWNQAGSGTGYHEAFHAIFRMAISDKEVDRYLKLAEREVLIKLNTKEKLNDALIELRASSSDYSDLSSQQIYHLLLEEYMADKFMEWKKNKEATKTSTGLKQLFRKLFNLIKELVRMNDSLESFFGKIDRGAFSSTKAVPNKQTFVTEKVYKNLVSGEETSFSSTKSKKIINTFAARVKKESRKPENSELNNEEILEKLIQERISNLNTKGKDYIKSITEPTLKANLIQAYKEEIYLLKNIEANSLLVEQVMKKLDIFDNKPNESEEGNEEGENNDKGGEDGFGSKESWTISLEEGTNKVIKEYIAFAMYETIDELTNELVLVSVDTQTIYNGLGHVLANTPEDQIMSRFIVYAKDNEQAKAVLDMIIADTDMVISEDGLNYHPRKNFNDLRKIITAFKNVKITFLHTEFNPIFNNGSLVSNEVLVYNANQNTAEKISISEWSNNLFSLNNKNQTNKEFWEKRIDAINNAFIKNKDRVVADEQLVEQIKNVQKALSDVGIKLSSGYLRYSILSFKEKFQTLSEGQLNDIAPFKDDIKPLDIMSIYGEPSGYSLAAYLYNGKDPYESGDDGMGGRMKEIARANGVFDESLASSNFKGADNNTRHDIIKSSYVLDEVIRLRSKDYRTKIAEKYEILKDNILLKNDSLLNKLTINLIDGVRDHTKNDTEGKVFGDFSEREYLMQHLGYWFSQTAKGRANFLFRQNEASNTAYIAEMAVNKYTNNMLINDDAVDAVYSFFKAEYSRISRESAKELGNVKGYNDTKSGRAFRFTEFANLLSIIGPAKYNEITENAKIGEEISKELSDDVKKAIKKSLENQIKEFKALLAENNLIGLEKEGGKVKTSNLLPKTIKATKLEGLELDNTLSEFYLNDYINSFSLNQLFDGDYALSRDDKGAVEKYYTFNNNVLIESSDANPEAVKVMVPKQALVIDIVKRNKGAMGSGSDLGNGSHRVAFIKDINVFVNGKKDGQLIRSDKGDKINSNDAQSYTNINHMIFMAERLGRMSEDVKSILRKIRRGYSYSYVNVEKKNIKLVASEINFKDLTYTENGVTYKVIKNDGITHNEQLILENAQASLNPWKTVTFGREFYIKTSEALIPRHEVSYVTDNSKYNRLMDELEAMEESGKSSKEFITEINKKLIELYRPIAGKEYYHKMLNQMDIHGIDQIVAESASKGFTLSPVDSLADDMDLSLAMIDIPNNYKRLQVETPTGKNIITAGTQLMQLIDSEQNDLTVVSVNGKNTTIGVVRAQYRSAMSKTRNNSFKLAESYIKKNADGTTDTSDLKKKFIKALEASGADDQLLEIFNLNWNLLPAIDKAEQLFLSHFAGGVLAQKVPGTKVSLMSDAHWNVVRDENGKVVLNKTVKAHPGKYKADPNDSKLKHNVRDPKTGQLYSECILSEKVFSKFGLKIGDEIPEAVATMLGYRIPTQDKHSMIALRVVDILPNYLEGTGIFPSEIVLLSGADFDIDSLFIQQPSFWMSKGGPIKAGEETDRNERWLGFLDYVVKNKIIDGEISDRLKADAEYKKLTSIKKKLRTKEDNEKITARRDEIRKQALEYLRLPTNESDFNKLHNEGVEVNNNILNNKILDAEIALLTNKSMEDIALTPISSKPLEDEAEYIQSLKEWNNQFVSSSSSLLGKAKAFFQNSAGKAGIGPVANALQAFTFLAKNEISRSEMTPLMINSIFLSKFQYLNDSKGRIADTLSTILSVMTDNAKDPIAGKMGLSLELLTTYCYLISLGVPLRTASLIINTPSVQMYSKLLKENNYGIKTELEKNGTKNDKLALLFSQVKGVTVNTDEVINLLASAGPINTEGLNTVISEGLNNSNRDLNFDILIAFLKIESESKYFQDLNNLIKLTKGLPTSFTDVDNGMIESLYKLGLDGQYGLEERLDEATPPFDLSESIKGDEILNQNIELALKIREHAKDIFISESGQFKKAFNKFRLNIKTNLMKDTVSELKRNFLGWVSTRAYIKYMKTREDSPIANFNPTNDNLLFPQLGGDTLAKELVKLKNSPNESISNNAFIRWLKAELGVKVDGEDSSITFDKVSGKSFIKLSTESINDIVNSFLDLHKNPETKQFSIDCFHYLITKDNLEYKNDSFVKYIAPKMFSSISQGLNIEMKDLVLHLNSEEFNENSDEFRKILASYPPAQNNFKQVKQPENVKNEEGIPTANSFKDEIVFDLSNSKGLFEFSYRKPTRERGSIEHKVKKLVKKEGNGATEEAMFKILDEVDIFKQEDIKEAKKLIDKVYNTVGTDAQAKKAYRKLSFKFHPDKNKSATAEEIFKYLNNTNEGFKEGEGGSGNIYETTSFWEDFDTYSWYKKLQYKYPEYIIVRIGENTNLYYNEIKGADEDWNTSANYKKLPSFGFKNISLLGKDYESNLNTYTKLEKLKKEDKKGSNEAKAKKAQEKAQERQEEDDWNEQLLINGRDALSVKIPDQQNKPTYKYELDENGEAIEIKEDNNLESGEKKVILYKDEKTDLGVPVSQLYDEATWNSFEQIKKDYIKKCH